MAGLLFPLAVLAAGSNVAGRRDAKWRSDAWQAAMQAVLSGLWS
jgi:hypothetical protein